MAEEQPVKQSYQVSERRCRIVLDVPIRITEITPESVASYFTPDKSEEGMTWEWAERQNRLLRKLLADEEALNRFLIGIANSELGLLLQNDSIDGLSGEEEGQLMEGLYSGMGSADAHFFREAERDGILSENTELFHRAFVTSWKEAKLTSLMVVE